MENNNQRNEDNYEVSSYDLISTESSFNNQVILNDLEKLELTAENFRQLIGFISILLNQVSAFKTIIKKG